MPTFLCALWQKWRWRWGVAYFVHWSQLAHLSSLFTLTLNFGGEWGCFVYNLFEYAVHLPQYPNKTTQSLKLMFQLYSLLAPETQTSTPPGLLDDFVFLHGFVNLWLTLQNRKWPEGWTVEPIKPWRCDNMTLMNRNWTVRLIRKLKKITRSKTRWLSQVWLIPSS